MFYGSISPCFCFKLDSLCLRNQQRNQNTSSNDSVRVATTANLANILAKSWGNQQQVFGDQVSLEYAQSCSNRPGSKTIEVKSVLTRPTQINEVLKFD